MAHPFEQGRVIVDLELSNRSRRGVEGEMLVYVDQAGQERHVAEIDDLRPDREVAAGADVDDAADRDREHRVIQHLVGGADEGRRGGEQHHASWFPSADRDGRAGSA